MIILLWSGKSWSTVCIVYFNTVISVVDMKIWVNVFLFFISVDKRGR